MRKVYYYNEKDLEGLQYVAKVVDFGVGLIVTSAINEMRSAYTFYIIERKDLYRGNVKYCCNNALREAMRTETNINNQMMNKSFWDDYSDRVIDESAQDISNFRTSILTTLKEANVKDAEAIAYIETARVLLNASVILFDNIMKQAKQQYKRDYSSDFSMYRLHEAFKWWGRMCDLLYENGQADMNTEETGKLFDKMYKKFADGDYIDACMEEAKKNNPDFVENWIIIRK